VDDDEDMRDALKVILEQSGIRVAARGSAKEAFEAFHDVRPDVLLCDIAMPGEDGLSLIRRVRSLPPERGGDVPAAAISAFTGAEDRRTARLAGFHYHVAKPVDPQRLLALIATMARARRLPARSASVPVSRG
jgi:CheY-like chemotaxis protein